MKNNLFMFRNVILCGTFLITFGWIVNSFAQAQCPVDNRLVKMPASDGKYYLPENYVFKVKFDAPVSTDTYKTASIVQFNVIENVFGVKLPEFETDAEAKIEKFKSDIDTILRSNLEDTAKANKIEGLFETVRETIKSKIEAEYKLKIEAISVTDLKKDEKTEKLEKEKADKIKDLSKMPEAVVVIPKNSKGYGKVERAKRQLPLFLNYKARISVVLDYVLLDNGDCIPIEIMVSPDTRLYNEGEADIGNVIKCRSGNLSGKKCIKGRRPRFNFVSPILSGGATVATILVKDPTAQALAGVTAIDQLTKGDLGNVINGADAQISDKLIYEVTTTTSRIGTFKKEDKKP